MLNTMMKKSKKAKKGFTLAELVIVVAIIAILTGLAVVVFGNMTDSAQKSTFEANHRTIISATVMAVAENNGSVDGLTTTAIDKYVSNKKGEQGVQKLQGSPKGATYAVAVDTTTGVVTVTSTFNNETLTYSSK